jgi:hypothetical protein
MQYEQLQVNATVGFTLTSNTTRAQWHLPIMVNFRTANAMPLSR